MGAERRELHTFPLIARRRLAGLPFGGLNSIRRGSGSDIAGSRPYVRGDDVGTIDWRASAKRSSARGVDEWIVRERFAEEAPRTVIVCDRRPAMRLYEPPLPWLRKPLVASTAAEMIAESTLAARGMVGYLDIPAQGVAPSWIPPATRSGLWAIHERLAAPDYDAPEDGLEQAFASLAELRRDLPAGTFVFVISDFVARPSIAAWIDAMGFGWDITPVVVQDPTWEQSFPAVGSLVVPFLDPATGRVVPARIGTREAARLRREHEARRRQLLSDFDALGAEPVMLDREDSAEILEAFITWADLRAHVPEAVWL